MRRLLSRFYPAVAALSLLLAFSFSMTPAAERPDPPFTADSRIDPGDPAQAGLISQLITFLDGTVYAGQIVLSETGQVKGDPEIFSPGTLSLERLGELASYGDSIAAIPGSTLMDALAYGDAGGLDAERYQDIAYALPLPSAPGLPLNVLRAYLEKRLEGQDKLSVRAVSSLLQLCMEIERDADLLQDFFRIYINVGLKVSLSQLGLPAGEDDLLKIGQELSPLTAKCPYSTTPQDWQVMLYKLEMWGAKNTGQRDRKVLASELLKDPAVSALRPALAKLPPRRVAFLGHSLTMSLHWSTYGSWCDIAAEVVKQVNPQFEYGDFNSGGLTPTRAVQKHLKDLLAWHPDETYMLMSIRNKEDRRSLEKIISDLKGIGCKVFIVDDVRPWGFRNEGEYKDTYSWLEALCRKEGATFLAFQQLYKKAPVWKAWRPLTEDIHLRTEGHIFYARELLNLWAGKM